MGREIRMVPPNWDHPKVIRRNGREGYQPMRKGSFVECANEWKESFAKWEAGDYPDYCSEENKVLEYWEWAGNPPDREYFQPWKKEEATWYQVWETVSEGTPVTPPFATKEELIDYLVDNGDYWDQSRREERKQGQTIGMNCEPWNHKNAEAFVNGPGWAPSMILDAKGLRSGVEAIED